MALETRLAAKFSGRSRDIFRKKVGPRERIVVKASSGGDTIFITALVTRKGETAGQLYVDNHLFDFERKVSKSWSTERWENVLMYGQKVMIKILNISNNANAQGARIAHITIIYKSTIE